MVVAIITVVAIIAVLIVGFITLAVICAVLVSDDDWHDRKQQKENDDKYGYNPYKE